MERPSAQARAHRLAVLLGTASMAALASTAANAADAGATPVIEEVLVTGSLIAGGQAVGVPVTALSENDFIEAGALNVLEALETVPALTIPPTNSPAFGAGTLHFANNVQIHGLGDGDTLMMADGRRWPLQGYDGLRVDPAIFPQLALSRTDVLSAGASATYGADATAGVLNVVLKRGFDGAQTFARFGAAPGAGNENVTFSQLYGRTWDGGGLAVTYEFQLVNKVVASDLFYYTWNFNDAGFPGFDFTQIDSSNPGFVSIGRTRAATGVTIPVGFAPDREGGIYCDNCFALPHGIGWNFGDRAPGPTTSWTTIQAKKGIDPTSLRNPWDDKRWARPSMESNSAVMTFDQRLTPSLDVFGADLGSVAFTADLIYSNRRFKQSYPTDQGQGRANMSPIRDGYRVPTNNPYYPTGVPAGTDVRAHFTLAPEIDTPIIAGGQVNTRWEAGLRFDELPFDWHGTIDYTLTDNMSYGYDRGGIIPNMASAALGNIVTYNVNNPPGTRTITKPNNVPFLNPFCDATLFRCNSPITIAYIQGHRDQLLKSHFSEFNTQLDGPIFDLPAGPIVVAAAFNHLMKAEHFRQEDNTAQPSSSDIAITGDEISELSNAGVFQANIPIFGGDFTFPLFQSLDLELGYRVDSYSDLDKNVYTPKIAANWGLGMGLTLRGSWGKSFRTPKGEEISASGAGVSGLNVLSGIENIDSTVLDCGTGKTTPPPNTLTALLNPTCSTVQALRAPAMISVSGPPTATGPILQASGLAGAIDTSLGPQSAKQYNLGFNFAPRAEDFGGWLNGLNVDVTYWNLDYVDLIGSIFQGSGPSDPLSTPYFIPIPNPGAPITDASNAAFFSLVKQLAALPTRTSRAPSETNLLGVKAIQVNVGGNLGQAQRAGIDFTVRYDWEMADWGSFNIGASGYYELHARERASANAPWTDAATGVALTDLKTSGNQLKKVRYRVGWADGGWNVTTFFNYYGHSAQDVNGIILLPKCFYAVGFGPGSCYPGSPYYGPLDEFPLHSPANVLVDLTVGYNTGTTPTNAYLQNITVQLGVTNLLDKNPPLGVHPLRSRGTGVAAYDRNYPDLKREVSLTIVKAW